MLCVLMSGCGVSMFILEETSNVVHHSWKRYHIFLIKKYYLRKFILHYQFIRPIVLKG